MITLSTAIVRKDHIHSVNIAGLGRSAPGRHFSAEMVSQTKFLVYSTILTLNKVFETRMYFFGIFKFPLAPSYSWPFVIYTGILESWNPDQMARQIWPIFSVQS